MKLELANGGFTLIDNEDYELLSKYNWFGTNFGKGKSPMANMKIDGKWVTKRMHRFLMGDPRGLVIDHINHNPLDNRRRNLRACTPQENRFNSKPVGRIKGVTKQHNKWRVRVTISGIRYSLGMYDSLTVAEKVANKFYQDKQGVFAYGNNIR